MKPYNHHTGVTKNMILYEDQVKQLLSNKDILTILLKGLFEPFKNMDDEEIMLRIGGGTEDTPFVRGINTESSHEGHGKVIYDLGFTVRDADDREYLLYIDVQSKAARGRYTGNRIIFYGARKLADQKNIDFTNDHYENMKPVLDL